MIWLDKHGWPVVFIKNRRIINTARWLLHVSLWTSIRQRHRWEYVGPGECRMAGDEGAGPIEEKK